MRRNFDLVRGILLKLEQHEHGSAPRRLQVEGYTDEQVGFHVHLMGQADLLEVEDSTTTVSQSPAALPLAITWAGYEFLEASRQDTVWRGAKKRLMDAGAGFSLELLKTVLMDLSKRALGVW